MKNGYILNPSDELVSYVKNQVKENNGYCIYIDKTMKRAKNDKCPKACKSDDKECVCGMYVKDFNNEGDFYEN